MIIMILVVVADDAIHAWLMKDDIGSIQLDN
jgi:hypothetical protein